PVWGCDRLVIRAKVIENQVVILGKNMGDIDINTLTMEHYMALIRDNNRSGVVKLEIVNDVDFEIKIQFMKELRHNLFAGTEDEDAHGHVQRVLEIANLFHIHGVTHDAIMLRVFPITLTGETRRWKNMLPAGSVTTWGLLEKAFIWKYCTSFKTARKIEEIQNYKQGIWMRHCIRLGKGLEIPSRKMLDSEGLIPMMYDEATTWQRSNHSSNNIAVITNKLDSLGCDIKKLKESIHAMQEGFKSRQGVHLTQECPLIKEDKEVEQDEWINKFRENTDLNLKKLDDITKNLEVKVERLTQTVLTNEGNTVEKFKAMMEKVKEVMKEPVPRNLPIFNPYLPPISFPDRLEEHADEPYISRESVCMFGFSKETHEEELELLIDITARGRKIMITLDRGYVGMVVAYCSNYGVAFAATTDRALEGGRQRVLREGRRDALGSYEGEKSEGSDKNYGCERKDEEGERGGERGGSEKPRVGGKERERDDKGGEELETVRRRESTTKWGSKGRRRDAGD
ncbi:hypothetical protein Tco_1112339, partial [Tanacetum coccineum]